MIISGYNLNAYAANSGFIEVGAGGNQLQVDSIMATSTPRQLHNFKISNGAGGGLIIDTITLHFNPIATGYVTDIAEVSITGAVGATVTNPSSATITFGTDEAAWLTVGDSSSSADINVKIKLKNTKLSTAEIQTFIFSLSNSDVGVVTSGATDTMMSGGDLTGSACALNVDATKLIFDPQPVDSRIVNPTNEVVSGLVFQTQPVVQATDACNNVDIDFTETVTLSLQAGSGALAGTLTKVAASGVANFSTNGLKYTVSSNVDSEAFTIRANDEDAVGTNLAVIDTTNLSADIVATKLIFSTPPGQTSVPNGNIISGIAFSTQPVVTAQDADNKVDYDYVTGITLSSTGSGTVGGTYTLSASSGTAGFTNVKYTTVTDQESVTVRANSSTLTLGAAGPLTVDIVATKLVFTTQPADSRVVNLTNEVASGLVFQTQPVVKLEDNDSNVDVDYSGTVTLSNIGAGSLAGTLTKAISLGIANFSGQNLAYTVSNNVDGEAFTIRAGTGSLPTVDTFNLSADIVATKLVFSTPPGQTSVPHGNIISGIAFSTQPVVAAQDADNKVDYDYVTGITLSSTGSGTVGGTYTLSASSGTAGFTNVKYTTTADQESIIVRANSQTLTLGTTGSLTVDIVATKLAFSTQPADSRVVNVTNEVVSGLLFQTQPIVQIQDNDSNLDLNYSGTVTLSKFAGAGTLGGTLTKGIVSAEANFSGLSVVYTVSDNNDGEAFTIRASTDSLPSVDTTNLSADIVATKLVFSALPGQTSVPNGNLISGIVFSTQPVVIAKDANDLVDYDYVAGIALSTTGSGSMGGTYSLSAVTGVANFTNAKYTASSDQESVTVRANSGSLTLASSGPYTVDVVATQLVFTAQPSSSVIVNIDIDTNPVISSVDADSKVDINDAETITVSPVFSSDLSPAAGTLTLTPLSGSALVSGVYANTLLKYNRIETIKLKITGSNFTTAVYSNAISVTPGVSDGKVIAGSGGDSSSIDSISGITSAAQVLNFKITNPNSFLSPDLVIDRITVHLDSSSTGSITDISEMQLSGAVTATVSNPTSSAVTFGTAGTGFDNGLLTVVDSATCPNIVLKIKLKNAKLSTLENQTFVFNTDDNDITENSGTSDFMGASGVDVLGTSCKLAVAATKLNFNTQPSSTLKVNQDISVHPVICATDNNSNVDVDITDNLTVSAVNPTTFLAVSGTLSIIPSSGSAMVNGYYNNTLLKYSMLDTIKLKISSINFAGPYYSNAIEIVKADSIAPADPVGTKVSKISNGYLIEWDAASKNEDDSTLTDLLGYRIYRAENLDGTYVLQAEITDGSLSWQDTNIQTDVIYYYSVRAVDISLNESKGIFLVPSSAAGTISVGSSSTQSEIRISAQMKDSLVSGGENIIFNFTRQQGSEAGKSVISYEIKPVKSKSGTEVRNFTFSKSVEIIFKNIGSIVAAGVKSFKTASLSGNYPTAFWFNGVEWVKIGGTYDESTGNLTIKTAYVGKFKVKESLKATEFTLVQITPTKIFTPNGDGVWDKIEFFFENPKDSIISHAKIYDLKGREVADLQLGNTGTSYSWDGKDNDGNIVSNGVYIYQIEAEGKVFNGMVVVAK